MRPSKQYALLSLTLGCVVGCQEEGAQEPLPDWSDGYEIAPADGGYAGALPEDVSMAITVPADVQYPVRLYRDGTDDEPCVVDADSDDFAERDIHCTMDMNELDLFVLGVRFDTLAAPGMCDFVLHSAPLFATFPIGEGPLEVSFTRHEDGSVSNETSSQAGEPHCPFDHRPAGPNCCYGNYTLEETSAMTGLTAVSQRSWGSLGDLAPCYEGAAFYGTDLPISANGFPADRIVYVDRAGYADTREFDGLSATHPRISYPLANYYDPDDHGGQAPAPLRALFAEPDYVFHCLDDAEESVARIRLSVREWNEEREFDRRGDSDTEGTERDWETPLNDVRDWRDIVGDDAYPLIARPEDDL